MPGGAFHGSAGHSHEAHISSLIGDHIVTLLTTVLGTRDQTCTIQQRAVVACDTPAFDSDGTAVHTADGAACHVPKAVALALPALGGGGRAG